MYVPVFCAPFFREMRQCTSKVYAAFCFQSLSSIKRTEKMSFIKTPSNKRDTYPYDTVKGEALAKKPETLIPGVTTYLNEFGEVETLSNEWISYLHRADDREIYNNHKASNSEFGQDKEKRKLWDEEHPHEYYEKAWVQSYDYETPDGNPSPLLDKLFVMGPDYETPDEEIFNDLLEEYSPESRESRFLKSIHINTKLGDFAKSESISSSAVSKLKGKIIKENKKK